MFQLVYQLVYCLLWDRIDVGLAVGRRMMTGDAKEDASRVAVG